jgi:hypothetical protein
VKGKKKMYSLGYITLLTQLFMYLVRSAPTSTEPTHHLQNRQILANGTGYLTVMTEEEQYTDCNEFPDIWYGDNVREYSTATAVNVTCWANDTVDGNDEQYLKNADGGCYINENDIQSGDVDWLSVLPFCGAMRPYAVWYGTLDALLPIDGYFMNCYACPSQDCEATKINWAMTHTYCHLEGAEVNGST